MPHGNGITVLDDGATPDNQPSDSDESASDSGSPAVTDSDSDEPAQPSLLTPGPTSKPDSVPAQQQDQQVAELQEFQDVQERREETKQQMGVTASKLLQNPEANLPSMRSLLNLATDKDSQVSKKRHAIWGWHSASCSCSATHGTGYRTTHGTPHGTVCGTTDGSKHSTAYAQLIHS